MGFSLNDIVSLRKDLCKDCQGCVGSDECIKFVASVHLACMPPDVSEYDPHQCNVNICLQFLGDHAAVRLFFLRI